MGSLSRNSRGQDPDVNRPIWHNSRVAGALKIVIGSLISRASQPERRSAVLIRAWLPPNPRRRLAPPSEMTDCAVRGTEGSSSGLKEAGC